MNHLSNAELFDEAAKICTQIKALEKYKKALTDAINDRIENHLLEDFRDGNAWAHNKLTVRQQTRRSWQYSEAVKTLQEQEEAEGVATRKLTVYSVLSVSDAE